MVLTPLVDIVFLLLTFFMLSSQLAPFSTLAFQDGASPPSLTSSASAVASDARFETLLSVGAGRLRLNGQDVTGAELRDRLRAEIASGATRLTLLASQDATVQDFVSALEVAKQSAFPSITVANMR